MSGETGQGKPGDISRKVINPEETDTGKRTKQGVGGTKVTDADVGKFVPPIINKNNSNQPNG